MRTRIEDNARAHAATVVAAATAAVRSANNNIIAFNAYLLWLQVVASVSVCLSACPSV